MPFVSILVGAIVLGAIWLRISTFDKDKFVFALNLTLFVFLSLGIGTLFTSYNGAFASEDSLFGSLQLSEDVLERIPFGRIMETSTAIGMTAGFIGLGIASMNEWNSLDVLDISTKYALMLIVFCGAMLIGLASGVVVSGLTYAVAAIGMTTAIPVLAFFLCLLLLAVLNALFGIVASAISIAFVVVKLVNGDSVNFLSLIGLIEVIPGQSQVVSIALLIVATVCGALEFSHEKIESLINALK